MDIRTAAERVINTYLNTENSYEIFCNGDRALILHEDDDVVVVTLDSSTNQILPTITARYLGSDDYLPTLYPTVEDANNALPATTLLFHASTHYESMRDILDELGSMSGFIPLEPMGDCGDQWAEPATTPVRHIMAVILPEPGESWSLDVEYHRADSIGGLYADGTAITTLGDWGAVVHIS